MAWVGWQRVLDLVSVLGRGADVEDDEIVAAVAALRMQTNCDCAAEAYFSVVAPVLAGRGYLAARLLRWPLDCLVCLGFESAVAVEAWVARYVTEPTACGVPLTAEGRAWLLTELPKHRELVTATLAELWMESGNGPPP